MLCSSCACCIQGKQYLIQHAFRSYATAAFSFECACRRELLGILKDAMARPAWSREPFLQQPLLVMLADSDGEIRAAALAHWHAVLPRAVPARLQVGCRVPFVDATVFSQLKGALNGSHPVLGVTVTCLT